MEGLKLRRALETDIVCIIYGSRRKILVALIHHLSVQINI